MAKCFLVIAILIGTPRQDGARPPAGSYGNPELHFPLADASCVAFAADGMTLAAGGGKLVRLWNAAGGQLHRTIELPDDVAGISLGPDGNSVAIASRCSVRLWKNGEALLLTEDRLVTWTAFSPDGTLVAAGGKGPVSIWEAATGKERATIEFPAATVTLPAIFSLDGTTLTTAACNVVQVWDLATRKELRRFEPSQRIDSLAASPDRMSLAIGGRELSGDKKCHAAYRVLDFESWRERSGRHWHTGEFHRVAWSPDGGRFLYTHLFDSGVEALVVMDAKTQAEVHEFHDGAIDKVTGVAFSPDGRRLAVAMRDKGVFIFPTP